MLDLSRYEDCVLKTCKTVFEQVILEEKDHLLFWEHLLWFSLTNYKGRSRHFFLVFHTL